MYGDGTLMALDERWTTRVATAIDRHARGELPAALEAATTGRNATHRVSAPLTVAVLPVAGFIEKRTSWLGALFGSCSTQQLIADVSTALADEKIDGLVLLVDSPGGAVDGVEEAAAVIRAARERKPVVSVIDGLAASAAYWIASQANSITLSPSGEVGSVGVFSMQTSVARALDREGIDVHLIRRPDAKVEGHPAIALTDKAKAAVQDRVDEVYRRFVRGVALGRGTTEAHVKSSYGEGRTLMSADARRAGMVDAIAAPHDALRLAVNYIGRATTEANKRASAYAVMDFAISCGEHPPIPKVLCDDTKIPFLETPDEYSIEAADEIWRYRLWEWEQSDREARARTGLK